MSEREHALYTTDGEGNWWKRTWAKQCPEKTIFLRECQGVEGHDDIHWCYREDGSLEWDDNDNDRRHNGCSGTTPPGHANWTSPVDMAERHYMNHFTDEQILDPVLLGQLERDELDVATVRPVSMLANTDCRPRRHSGGRARWRS